MVEVILSTMILESWACIRASEEQKRVLLDLLSVFVVSKKSLWLSGTRLLSGLQAVDDYSSQDYSLGYPSNPPFAPLPSKTHPQKINTDLYCVQLAGTASFFHTLPYDSTRYILKAL